MQSEEIIWSRYFKGAPFPYWVDSTGTTNYPSLNENISTDVVIVGGGMTGIVTAYMLLKEGLEVVILEADKIVQGTSAHTTAKITSQHGLIYDKTANSLGLDMAKQYADANENAIKMISRIVSENNIDCDFKQQSAYVYTHLDKYISKIENEAKTAASLGINAHYIEETPMPFKVKAAVRFDNQAQFHPRKYLLSLARIITDMGCEIYENTRAVDLEEGKSCTVITDSGFKVFASNVVIASHYPFYDKRGLYFTRIYPERSYALGIIPHEKYPGGMYITAEDPGVSFRSQPYKDTEMIIVGGEHHKTGHGENTNQHYLNVLNSAKGSFGVDEVLYRWSTQDCMTMDSIPFIGHLTSQTPNIYVATGFQKWGMTSSHASAMILTDLITRGKSPWEDVYSPSRITVEASAKEFLKENADVAVNFVRGKILPADYLKDIKPGEGKIAEVDGKKVGVYCDAANQLHFVDTSCTHLGCGLEWNAAEKSWDCPCHGSRFTYEGEIVEGPALKTIKTKIGEKVH